MSINGALAPAAAVVAVDVDRTKAAVLVPDAQRHRLLGLLEFVMTASSVAEVIEKSRAELPTGLTGRVRGRRVTIAVRWPPRRALAGPAGGGVHQARQLSSDG